MPWHFSILYGSSMGSVAYGFRCFYPRSFEKRSKDAVWRALRTISSSLGLLACHPALAALVETKRRTTCVVEFWTSSHLFHSSSLSLNYACPFLSSSVYTAVVVPYPIYSCSTFSWTTEANICCYRSCVESDRDTRLYRFRQPFHRYWYVECLYALFRLDTHFFSVKDNFGDVWCVDCISSSNPNETSHECRNPAPVPPFRLAW